MLQSLFLAFCFFTSALAFCPRDSDWYSDHQKCYHVSPYVMDYEQGVEYCENLNMAIASFGSQKEKLIVLRQARRKVSESKNYFWLGGYFDGSRIHWKDGSQSAVWATNANISKGALLGNIKNDRLKSGATDLNKYQVACFGVDTEKPRCDVGWIYYPSSKGCYKLIGDHAGFTWPQAQSHCQSIRANLTSIHSLTENLFLAELAKTYFPVTSEYQKRTGSYNNQYETHSQTHKLHTWIGGRRFGPNSTHFEWIDSTVFDFSNWETERQDVSKSYRTYVKLYPALSLRGSDGPDTDFLARRTNWDEAEEKSMGYNAIFDGKAQKSALTKTNCTATQTFCVKYVQDGGDVKLTRLECADVNLNPEDDAACQKVETRHRYEGEISHTTTCCDSDLCNQNNGSQETSLFSTVTLFCSLFIRVFFSK